MDAELERVKQLAKVLDSYFLDPILGLILPGAGDILGSLLGVYTIHVAVRRKHSPVVIARMLLNLALDALLGIVPLLGDLFDFGFKANQKNVELLTQRAEQGGKATARDWAWVVLAALVFAAAIVLPIYGIVALARAIR